MATPKKETTDNTEFAHAEAPAPRAPEAAPRNLTQEALQGFFEQKKAEAALMEKPPKDLVDLDPAKRAARMCQPG
jgi:hypothetical protein